MEQYLVVMGKTSTGYGAHCPDVLGCVTVGDTPEECITNMKEALELHFHGMMEDGDSIPESGGAKTYRDFMSEENSENYLLGHVQINTEPYRSARKTTLKREIVSRPNGKITDPTTDNVKKAKAPRKIRGTRRIAL